MKLKFLALYIVLLATAAFAGPTNSILFVTQVSVVNDFVTVASVFGNHRPEPDRCGRGGDLYIRYPNGTLKNLTRASGFGVSGPQQTNGIAVRQPAMHWSGTKAVFSMIVGTPRYKFDYAGTTNAYWQIYEITNFTDPSATPIITKVSNQPTNYNNISPTYGTDDRILFTSDRPRNGQRHLYPQLDEYEEQATVTGVWSLDPASGDLALLSHSPSGAFSPMVDSAGRVIFIRWDHLQRDQQADYDAEYGQVYGTFNWSDESAASVATTNVAEVYPEPRSDRTDLLAGTNLRGHTFNQFFPWQINEDGTEEETVNHVGRHELGGSYAARSFTNDVNLTDFYYFGANYNTNPISNFIQVSEDPVTPGLFYGIDAPEFATHGAGQVVSLAGGTNLNASQMRIAYLTARSTHLPAPALTNVPPDHSGLYRTPIRTTDGYLIASHTSYPCGEPNGGDPSLSSTPYDFRLKILVQSNGVYVPGQTLTSGITNPASFWTPDAFVSYSNALWEFDPVEVVARPRPQKIQPHLAAPEQAAFDAAGVNVAEFKNYLKIHNLALINSRDVTTRDKADRQQPFNLRVAGTTHQSISANGKIYDIAGLQLFQADQLRSISFGNLANPRPGRRVLAQFLHDPAADNVTNSVAASTVRIANDGSMAALVPARRAITWQLTDTNDVGVVRERYWVTFAPGEIRTCASCHGVNTKDQLNRVAPTNTPSALISLLTYWKTNQAAQPAISNVQGTNYFDVQFVRRPAETGVTHHVQASTNLTQWTDIATYSGTNIYVSSEAIEVSRSGSPNETVTLRDATAVGGKRSRFLRVTVTNP